MKKRRFNVACLQETKWKENKAKELTNGYKLYHAGANNARNEVGSILGKDLNEQNCRVKEVG